jgi:hypothetical protein
MKNFFISLCLLSLFLLLSCTHDKTEYSDQIIYYNGFENQEDLKTVQGFKYLSKNTEKNLGDSCLVVSAGCIIPHTSINIPIDESMSVIITVMIKNENEPCGGLYYSTNEIKQNIELSSKLSTWDKISSEEIQIAKGDTLKLTIISGGFKSCTTFFDELTVMKVEN